MRTEQFNYNLPKERIAQRPLAERDASRLMIVDRKSGDIKDALFRELAEYLVPSDILVVNNCKVMAGRLRGKRRSGAKLELTLIHRQWESEGEWEALVRGRQPRPGEEISISNGSRGCEELKVEFIQPLPFDPSEEGNKGGRWRIRFRTDKDVEGLIEKHGATPLPPYIRRGPEQDNGPDRESYQTIFAKQWGAAAAPTAGLHFTNRMLERIREVGAGIAEITLWVSYGTFAPVRVSEVEQHRMCPERFEVSPGAAKDINETSRKGGRVVAAGTTVVRTLEHCADANGLIRPGRGQTSLFIYPGYSFRMVDAMLTNFHLPRSSLLMLVTAFGGKELITRAYTRAIEMGYRFLSYGDAMLII